MLDLEIIQEEISQLENEPTTYANCNKLAILYSIIDHNIQGSVEENSTGVSLDPIIKEYEDILPSYMEYKNTKTKYQMNLLPFDNVSKTLSSLCNEIEELIDILYMNSANDEERNSILILIDDCYKKFH